MTLLLLGLGIALLLGGGTIMVRGASGIAESYGVPPIAIGLTVIAFGTSAPELVVNIIGSLRGETALAFGNITGSNLANIGLVLGLAALITPIQIQGQIIRRELPLLLLVTAVLLVMTMDPLLRNSPTILDRSEGAVMFLLFGIFFYIMASDLITQREDALVESVGALPSMASRQRSTYWLQAVSGTIGLALGGKLTIDHGTELAMQLGVQSVVIGMFVVAIGTSLPELVTSIIAATKGKADLCVGNVIGSNLFNTLFVLPISAAISPIPIPAGGTMDMTVTFGIALLLIPVFIIGNSVMNRSVGLLFLALYFGYMALRLLGS